MNMFYTHGLSKAARYIYVARSSASLKRVRNWSINEQCRNALQDLQIEIDSHWCVLHSLNSTAHQVIRRGQHSTSTTNDAPAGGGSGLQAQLDDMNRHWARLASRATDIGSVYTSTYLYRTLHRVNWYCTLWMKMQRNVMYMICSTSLQQCMKNR